MIMAKVFQKVALLIRYLLTYNYYFLRIYLLALVEILRQGFESYGHLQNEYPSQDGSVAIITGGSSGIGFELTQRLCGFGVHVIIAGRCPRDGAHALEQIWTKQPTAKVDFIQLDLSSRASINDFSGKFKKMGLPLHLLINNAGIMMCPYQTTVDGLEEQLAVNYAGPWLLTYNLLDVLKKTGTPRHKARIINVASSVHFVASFPDVEVLLKTSRGGKTKRTSSIATSIYSPHASYAESKLLAVMGTYTLHRRLSTEHVTCCAVHPGVVATGLYRNVFLPIRLVVKLLGSFLLKTPAQCVDGVLPLVLGDVQHSDGRYFVNGRCVASSKLSKDEELQNRLWNSTCDLWSKNKLKV